MAQENAEEPWSAITQEERTLHEILFYSQGPVDGYILGEGVRDLLLKSGLSLTVLSQIWNLADVSNDNVLNVHEFVLIMHLIRGVMQGRPVPKTLPRSLTPPKTTPQTPPPMTQQEKDAYLRVFQTLDYSRAGYIDAQIAVEMFLATKLSNELLAHVWDLSDFGRDGKLNVEEFAVACHLLRYAKQGGSLDGPIDIFKYAPQHISPLSLLARKRRVAEYEEHKQRLMSLKERRKIQAVREAKRLDLAKEKVELLQELYNLLKKLGKTSEADTADFPKVTSKDKADNEKQEEIVIRLKKEHEKVRQETVKIILGEHKFNEDISLIKKDTDELNKRLLAIHTHATRDPDPFHQLYEQRKEKRQGSTIKDLDKIDIYIPFEFSPFDLDVTPDSLPSGAKLVSKGSNHKQSVADIKSVVADLKEFGEEFMDMWGGDVPASKQENKEYEDDEIFREVHDWCEDNWPSCDWSQDGLLGLTDTQVVKLKNKLSDLREELKKLNSQGGRLVFRNPEDYNARQKAREEEEKAEKGRVQRRSVTERLRSSSSGTSRTRDATNRYSYSGDRSSSPVSSEATQAAREYRLKRRSQQFDSASSSPEILRNPDRDRKLYRASTGPASVSDEASLSRESSLSSIDRPLSNRDSSQKLEEESSTIRTHRSSKTDDSGVLTLRSSRKKDDLSLELASVALGRPINVETVPAPVSAERAKRLELEAKAKEQNKAENRTLPPKTAEEPDVTKDQLEKKKHESFDVKKEVNGKTPTSPESPRRSSKKHRAPPPPSSAAPLSSLHDASVPDEEKPKSQTKSVIVSDESPNSVTLPSVSKSVDIKLVSVSEAKTLNNTQPSEVKYKVPPAAAAPPPQRPPRLKKTSGDYSKGPSTPTSPSPSVELSASAKDPLSSKNQISDKKSASNSEGPSQPLASRSDSTELPSPRREPSTKKRPAPIPQPNSTDKQSDIKKESQSSAKSVTSKSSFEHNTVRSGLNASKQDQRTSRNIKPEVEVIAIKEEIVQAKPTLKSAGKRNGLESETMIRVAQTPVNSASPGNQDARNRESLQLSLDLDKSKSKRGDATPSEPSDSDAESIPPPLPSSAPPPLPAGAPPMVTDDTVEEEEVVTVEYTVPVKVSTDKFGNTEVTEVNTGDKTQITTTSTTTKSSSNSVNEKTAEVTSPSSSKTISDLRSDFFGLKSPRSQKINTDIVTPGTTSLDVYFNDLHTEAKLNKRFGSGQSMDSDVSDDNDSGVHKGGNFDTFSPGDSGHITSSVASTPDEKDSSGGLSLNSSVDKSNKAPLMSSQKRSVFSNESTESAFDDSFSSSPRSTTVKTSPRPQSLFDDSQKQNTTQKSSTFQQKQTVSSSFASPPSSSYSQQGTSPTSPTQAGSKRGPAWNSPTEDKFMSPRSKEIVDKARHFADMVQPKQIITVKREKEVQIEDDFSQDALQDLEKERRAVISQSMVKRKVNTALSPTSDEKKTLEDAEDTLGSSSKPREKTSNPSEYGYLYSAEREAPPPEVGWTEKQTQEQKISLYSENVVKEGDTTETVDRESIANLSTTKRQWENIFTTHSTSTPQGDSTLKKKGTPKWEVRVPYTEKRPALAVSSTNQEEPQNGAREDSSEEDAEMFKKPEDTESAIEREIRLAHEREEMLKKEKEERQKQTDRQQKSQGQTIIASYEAVSAESESCQPAYNELTEADRGPDLWGVEAGARKEDDSASEASVEEANPNESIIEREIRLQREREEEISRMRKQSSSSVPQPKEQPQQQQQQQPQQQQQVYSPPPPPAYVPDEEEEEDVNHNQSKMTSYEDSIANTNHDGESLIARELRELKEREEEMRKIHESLHGTRITDEVDGPGQDSYTPVKPSSLNVSAGSQRPSQSSPSPAQGTWQRDVSPFVSQKRKESVDSTSSHSTGRAPSDTTPSRRDVRVQPISDGHDDDDEKPNYFQKQETPIEREMRIARERENELRRLKGLPEIVQKDDDPYGSYGASPEQSSNNSTSRPRSLGQPTDSMKKFASSRLQQELLQQKEREIALRSEGKIISTSEEHIEPLKYMSVAGVDKVDGTEKRNFVTKKTSVSYVEPESPSPAQEVTSPGAQAGQPTRKKSGAAAGGQLFSYKEFKQTAESKIERELREMREREEELRMQRTGAQPETPK